MISAKVIARSISPQDIQIITLQLRYPKFIHGELMTHRVFSRNASSSRAIPFEKFVKDIEDDPAVPIYWGANRPGMQAREEIEDIDEAKSIWYEAMQYAIQHAEELSALGVHKQVVNRLLEPFYCINTLVTSTEWENFFELRDHPDAQPEIRELAVKMKEAIAAVAPTLLNPGEWHLPYVFLEDQFDLDLHTQIKVSVARCARVSYLTQEGRTSTVEDDLKLYDRLVLAKPPHMSPTEHQATPDEREGSHSALMGRWKNPRLHGNFKGWQQYRKMLETKGRLLLST
jgi:thymidylate synthase ThyX